MHLLSTLSQENLARFDDLLFKLGREDRKFVSILSSWLLADS
jgi:hypothetical protein